MIKDFVLFCLKRRRKKRLASLSQVFIMDDLALVSMKNAVKGET